jgi:hypothetical protein
MLAPSPVHCTYSGSLPALRSRKLASERTRSERRRTRFENLLCEFAQRISRKPLSHS